MSAISTPEHDQEKFAGYDAEKNAATTATHALDGDRYAEGLGDLQVLKQSDSDVLKLANDGKTVLIPQPSDDPNDPLNWSFAKKHLVLLSMVFASLVSELPLCRCLVEVDCEAAHRLWCDIWLGPVPSAGSDVQHERSRYSKLDQWRAVFAGSWRCLGSTIDTALRAAASPVLVAVPVRLDGDGSRAIPELRMLRCVPSLARLRQHRSSSRWLECRARHV